MQIGISAYKYLKLQGMYEGKLYDMNYESYQQTEGIDPLSGFSVYGSKPTYILERFEKKDGKLEKITIEVDRRLVYNIEFVFLIDDKNDIKEIDLS